MACNSFPFALGVPSHWAYATIYSSACKQLVEMRTCGLRTYSLVTVLGTVTFLGTNGNNTFVVERVSTELCKTIDSDMRDVL